VKAQEALTAIVARTSGAPGSDIKRLAAKIERYMSEEEVGELKRILTAGGQQALLAAVQGHNLGSLSWATARHCPFPPLRPQSRRPDVRS
jgi:hypothetical protein